MPLRHFWGLHDPISSLSHLFSAGAALGGSYFLYKKGAGSTLHRLAYLIFSASLLFLFSMSGTYHALSPGPMRAAFRRLDYAAIWVVIAGSATPVHVLLFKGHWRWGLIGFFWGVALALLVIVDLYFSRLPYSTIIWAYIALSSLGAVSFVKITARYGWKETALLFLGGLAYSGGATIDYIERPVLVAGILGPHELFHFLVMAGAIMHWCFIYNWPHEA